MELITTNLPTDGKVRFGLLDMHDDIVVNASADQIAFMKRIRYAKQYWNLVEDFVKLNITVPEFTALAEFHHRLECWKGVE